MRRHWIITGLIFSLPFLALGQTSDDVNRRRAALETELAKVEAEIAIQEGLIVIKQKEAATLERDRQLLNSQIAKAKLVIRAHELEIERLGGDINKKAETITGLTKRLSKLTDSLAELLRQRRDLEDHNLIEITLTKASLADFFREADNYQYLEDWYKEFYPELFDFDNLERRIDFYDLSDILRMLPRFPHAKQLHERVNTLLSH